MTLLLRSLSQLLDLIMVVSWHCHAPSLQTIMLFTLFFFPNLKIQQHLLSFIGTTDNIGRGNLFHRKALGNGTN